MRPRRRVVAGALLGLIVGAIAFATHEVGWTKRWEYSLIDLRFRARSPQPDSGEVIVIGITRDCMDDPKLGPLPWRRWKFAEAVSTLNELGASAICFDIFFPFPAPDSDDKVDDDAELAAAMKEGGNVILPVFDKRRGVGRGVVELQENIALLAEQAAGLGHINVLPDSDGIVRRCPLRVGSTKRKYLQLGVAGAAWHLSRGATEEPGGVRVPVDEEGNLHINWRPGDAWRYGRNYFPFADLFHERLTRHQVEGKIVFIGQTDPGLVNADVVQSPFGARFGLFCQADIAESVISGHHVRPWGKGTHFAVLLVLSAALGMVLFTFRLVPMIASAVTAFVALPAIALAAFNTSGVLVDTIPALAAVTLLFCASLGYGLARKAAEARRWEEAIDVLRNTGFQTGRALMSRAAKASSDPLGITGSLADALQVPDVTPPTVLSVMADVLGAEHGFLRVEGQDGEARWISTMGDSGLACQARELAEVIASDGASEQHSRAIPRIKRDRSLRRFADVVDSALAVRLSRGEKILGTVVLCGKRPTAISPSRRFEVEDLPLALALVPQASLLLDHARLHRGLYAALKATVATLSSAMGARDEYTSGHSSRVAFYAGFLSEKMGLPEWCIEAVGLGALLHDIGKIAMDEVILRGATSLTAAEWELVHQHPVTGAAIFSHMEELSVLLPAIRHHHERYDGEGYPDGLAGDEIPLLGRIMGIADSFDAMTFHRPYRASPMTFSEACDDLLRNAGTQFDPDLARLFVEHAPPELVTEARTGGQTHSTHPPPAAASPRGSEAVPAAAGPG